MLERTPYTSSSYSEKCEWRRSSIILLIEILVLDPILRRQSIGSETSIAQYYCRSYLRLDPRYRLGFSLPTVNPVRRLDRSLCLSADGQINPVTRSAKHLSSAPSYKMTSSNASLMDSCNPLSHCLQCICTLAKRVTKAWLLEQCNGELVVSIV